MMLGATHTSICMELSHLLQYMCSTDNTWYCCFSGALMYVGGNRTVAYPYVIDAVISVCVCVLCTHKTTGFGILMHIIHYVCFPLGWCKEGENLS